MCVYYLHFFGADVSVVLELLEHARVVAADVAVFNSATLR
jgi:hypothetical protein